MMGTIPMPSQKSASIKNQRGFSVLEVLVVLVIVGLVVATMIPSVSQLLDARVRLAPFLDQAEQSSQVGDWYRQIVGGVVADYSNGAHKFKGDAGRISGLTVMAFGGGIGAPTPFELGLEERNDRVALTVRTESKAAVDLLTWTKNAPGAESARFWYFDGDRWVDHWPDTDINAFISRGFDIVNQAPPAEVPQLIRLDVVLSGRRWVFVANPRSPPRQPLRLEDIVR
jgi:prepilin-type N-terminal cleavage/methylation domain-containing protein